MKYNKWKLLAENQQASELKRMQPQWQSGKPCNTYKVALAAPIVAWWKKDFVFRKVILLPPIISKFSKKLPGSEKHTATWWYLAICNSQTALVSIWWAIYTMSFHDDTKKNPHWSGFSLRKGKCTHLSTKEVFKTPKYASSIFFFPSVTWDRSSSEWQIPTFAPSSLPVTSSSHKEQGCSVSVVNRDRSGRGKKEKVQKNDGHLFLKGVWGGRKRCFVSVSLHLYHTNTKLKQNNAVYLGFHKL